MEIDPPASCGSVGVPVLCLLMVVGLVAASGTGAALSRVQTGTPYPCFTVLVDVPPDVAVDPECSGALDVSGTSTTQGDSPLELSVHRADLGTQLGWEVPAHWADGEQDNGEVDRFAILRGPSPSHLEVISVTPGGARAFEDDHALLQGGAWYQVVAFDGDEPLVQSDRVLAGAT